MPYPLIFILKEKHEKRRFIQHYLQFALLKR